MGLFCQSPGLISQDKCFGAVNQANPPGSDRVGGEWEGGEYD